jgi:hypothetical protein
MLVGLPDNAMLEVNIFHICAFRNYIRLCIKKTQTDRICFTMYYINVHQYVKVNINIINNKATFICVQLLGHYISVNPTYALTNFGNYCISVLKSFRKFIFSLFVTD